MPVTEMKTQNIWTGYATTGVASSTVKVHTRSNPLDVHGWQRHTC